MQYVFHQVPVFLAVALLTIGCRPRAVPDPPRQTGAFLEGQRHFLNADYTRAVASFERFIAQNPKSRSIPEVHYWIGAVRLKQDRYSDAQEAFRRCLDTRPNATLKLKAWAGVGDCCRLTHRFDLAAQVYGRVLRTRNLQIERDLITFNRGVCLLRHGNLAAGKKTLEECAKQYPASRWASRARETLKLAGSFHVQTGAFSKRANAEKEMQQLKAKGFNPRIKTSSGNFCVRVGNTRTWKEALALANRLRAKGFQANCLP